MVIVEPRAVYVVQCRRVWDGDEDGNEWTCGFAVYRTSAYDGDSSPFGVYEDDGQGNGNYVRGCDTLDQAIGTAAGLAYGLDLRTDRS